MKSLIFSFLLLTCLYTSINAQGVIYSKEEADNLYGPVLSSYDIQNILLIKFFNQTEGTLMFRIQDGNLIILNNERIQLYPGSYLVSSNDIFRVFNVSLIDHILKNGMSSSSKVELRENDVISITNGGLTLEFGTDCPPRCP